MQLLVTVCTALSGNWLIFALCLPMAILHVAKLQSKDYRIHFITRQEFKPTQTKILKLIKFKLAYYLMLLLAVVVTLLFATSNMVLYHALGKSLGETVWY